ncbi:molybdenum cofactor biosynthesis protein A [Methanoculleus chikugoensis]|uniref:Molybdenum cofactor biosynthesis protein A n=1 Tax=Methanoculleus chikugoensis TaxID=118126 RepID=A0A1M4MP56_9EURY|nr:radical SAM protein [Methanoculleus chikugoensis]SCL76714.1 molybdenum cofactor biosynthesis protein A [Methanoculleus chikugoensis]
MAYRHLFGPVPSRRLGVSLGVDLVPQKTCAYNCVYCECGRTTDLTCERREYVPTGRVIAELDNFLAKGPDLDYVTFAGSGEPTLHSGIGEIIAFIKDRHPRYRVAVLTGSALLADPDVRAALMRADLVVPSLDAVSEEVFSRINRPSPGITAERVLAGLLDFAREYPGEVWLEVFIVPGINDTEEEIRLLKDAVAAINPHRVQVNTLDRPGTDIRVRPAAPGRLARIAAVLGGEVIGAACTDRALPPVSGDLAETILATIRRRPCTPGDLAALLGIRPAEVAKHLRVLESGGLIEPVREERGVFYRPV